MIRRAIHYIGLDRAVAFGSLARIWSMGSGIVTLLMVVAFFSPKIQGFYYTFLSLVALQAFAELGLGQVIIQFAAHEWAHLRLDENGDIAGDPTAERRLSGLAHFALRWFAIASFLFFWGIEGAGFFIFSGKSEGVAWQGPWTVLCVAVACDLCLLPLWSLLEGTNQVASIYFLRFARTVASGLVLWIAIASGAGLWSAAISLAAGVLAMVALAFRRHYQFFYSLFTLPPDLAKGWWHELWPMQWRIALSWLSGYFAFSLFTPVLFRFDGPVAAGQMGMSWSIVQALSGVAGMLVQTKAPTFGMLIAQRKWHELDRLALRVGIGSTAVMVAGIVVALVGLLLLNALHVRLVNRLLPFVPFLLLCIGATAIQTTIPMSAYLRAHKFEPLLVLSVTVGAMTAVSTVVLGYYFGQVGMMAGYAAICLFIALPWAIAVLQHWRVTFHL